MRDHARRRPAAKCHARTGNLKNQEPVAFGGANFEDAGGWDEFLVYGGWRPTIAPPVLPQPTKDDLKRVFRNLRHTVARKAVRS